MEPFLEHSGFSEADFVAYVGNGIQRRAFPNLRLGGPVAGRRNACGW
jgi:hypothetical protein